MSTLHFHLVRHAEVERRYHRVFGGRIDMELSPRGHEQAAHLSKYFLHRPVQALYASPMKRVQQTLAPLAKFSSAEPVILDGLREVDFGDWTGLSWDEVAARFQVSAFEWLNQLDGSAIPNAECPKAWRGRVEASLQHILLAHAGQDHEIAVICHGGVVRMLLSIMLDLPLVKMSAFDVEYASVTCVEHHARKTEVKLLNFTPWRDRA